jgi:hypothetical protein
MALLRTGAAVLAVLAVVASCAPDGGGSADFARSVDVGGRSVYLTCHGTAEAGEPTVVLISGYHDSSDVWTQSDVLGLIGSATGTTPKPTRTRSTASSSSTRSVHPFRPSSAPAGPSTAIRA